NYVCSSGFQIINSKENNLEFLFEYLRSDAGILQFKFYMTGALYPAITNKDLKKIKIPIPPLEVQDEIVAHITGLKKQIKQLRTAAITNRTSALTNFEQKIFK
ncbi:MAG: restriction endonuclease subunit S, partial [Bacteroidaceae bacterium]